MDSFKNSLEMLSQTPPQDILNGVLMLNNAIHSADEQAIAAIWHTLKAVDHSTKAGSDVWTQVSELLKSTKSRMNYLVSREEDIVKKKYLKEYFISIVGTL